MLLLRRRGIFFQRLFPQGQYAIRQNPVSIEIVADPHHCCSARARFPHDIPKQPPRSDIQPGARFIQQKQAGPAEQYAGEIETLGHPPGKDSRPVMCVPGQSDPLQRSISRSARLRAGESRPPGPEQQIFPRAEAGIDERGMSKKGGFRLIRKAFHRTGIGAAQAGHDAHQGGFAGAVGAGQQRYAFRLELRAEFPEQHARPEGLAHSGETQQRIVLGKGCGVHGGLAFRL